MTERTRSPHARPAEGRRAPEGTADEVESLRVANTPIRLRIAISLLVVGAALTVVGPAMGLVDNPPARGFASLPLLIALAAIPPLLAMVAAWTGRPVVAAGVLIGSALVAPGRALVDLQFVQDALLASRPELMVPTSLAPLSPAPGVWVLVGGHLAVAVAGLLAAGRAGAAPGSTYTEELDDPSGAPTISARRSLIGWALGCGTAAAVSLLMPSFRSDNAFQLTREVIDSPTLVRIGGLLIALAVLLGCVFAAGSARPGLARGVSLGLLASVAAVTVPGIAAGLIVDRLHPGFWPYLALASVGLLVVIVFLLSRPRDMDATEDATPDAELRLESSRLHLVAGVLGVLAGVAALGGALGALLVVDAGLEQPDSYANRQLVPVGLLVGALGGALLVRRWSAAVRPAFIVSLASIMLVGASTLDAALTGAAISAAVHIGAGVWFTGIAMVIATVAAGCAAIAGSTERDDVDLTERGVNRALIAPVAAAVLLAVGAFGLPAVKAPGFVAPGIWSDFRLTSWGLLFALAVVVAVGVLAPASRPARAGALLLGAAAVVGVRLLELPLTGDRAPQAVAGQGTWLSLACAAALVVGALVALVGRSRQTS